MLKPGDAIDFKYLDYSDSGKIFIASLDGRYFIGTTSGYNGNVFELFGNPKDISAEILGYSSSGHRPYARSIEDLGKQLDYLANMGVEILINGFLYKKPGNQEDISYIKTRSKIDRRKNLVINCG